MRQSSLELSMAEGKQRSGLSESLQSSRCEGGSVCACGLAQGRIEPLEQPPSLVEHVHQGRYLSQEWTGAHGEALVHVKQRVWCIGSGLLGGHGRVSSIVKKWGLPRRSGQSLAGSCSWARLPEAKTTSPRPASRENAPAFALSLAGQTSRDRGAKSRIGAMAPSFKRAPP